MCHSVTLTGMAANDKWKLIFRCICLFVKKKKKNQKRAKKGKAPAQKMIKQFTIKILHTEELLKSHGLSLII